MSVPAGARLALAAACLGLVVARHLRRPQPAPVVIIEATPAAVRPPDAALRTLEPDFAARMTPDDVARGLWALAGGEGPGLSPEEAQVALPLAREAASARARVDTLRTERRRRRAALRAASGALAAALVDAGWTPGGPR